MSAASHDPGGKVRTALPAGLRGDAKFSECGRYRHELRRWIGDEFPSRYLLLIGMNASTATGEYNDPTITREWGFTAREGYSGFVKCNVGDYRATNPKDIPAGLGSSYGNLPTILTHAAAADRVVVCWGKVPAPLQVAAARLLAELRIKNCALWCFGTNGDGSPKHPLYLAASTPLIPFGVHRP